MTDIIFSIVSTSILVVSVYAFCMGDHITAFYSALFYICAVICFKQGDY